MIWLAQRPQSPQKVREIAEDACAAPGYLIKILQSLTKVDILSAQRGIHGGFTLLLSAKLTRRAQVPAIASEPQAVQSDPPISIDVAVQHGISSSRSTFSKSSGSPPASSCFRALRSACFCLLS